MTETGTEQQKPLHERLYEEIRSWLLADYTPGSLLPKEQEIIARYQAGRGSVRTALEKLSRERIIERIPGKGTFLCKDVRLRLSRYKLGVILSSLEFSQPEVWEYTWLHHMEMLNGAYREAHTCNVELTMIPEAALLPQDHANFDGFLSFRYVSDQTLSNIKKPHLPFSYELDLYDGLYHIVEHMQQAGYKRAAYIGSRKKHRVEVINNLLLHAGLQPLPQQNIIICEGTERAGAQAAEQLIAGGCSFDAVICSTDLRASGVLKTLIKHSISIPEEVGLYGFDGSRIHKNPPIPITTFAFDWQELGARAVRDIRSVLDGQQAEEHAPLKGIIRQEASTRRVSGKKQQLQSSSQAISDSKSDYRTCSQKEFYASVRDLIKQDLPYAMEELVKLSQENGYLPPERLTSNRLYSFFDIERRLTYSIQINIARSKYNPGTPQSSLPAGAQCGICKEQAEEGGKPGLRILPFSLNNGNSYFLQLTPFPLYPYHFVLISKDHSPMNIVKQAIHDALQIAELLPDYTIFSNSDKAWAGASILEHRHYQLIKQCELPIMHAGFSKISPIMKMGSALISALNFPMSAYRISGPEALSVETAALRLLTHWKELNPAKHTINFLCRKSRDRDLFECCIILRHPDFRNPPQLQKYKAEGVGVIEAGGAWIFPLPA